MTSRAKRTSAPVELCFVRILTLPTCLAFSGLGLLNTSSIFPNGNLAIARRGTVESPVSVAAHHHALAVSCGRVCPRSSSAICLITSQNALRRASRFLPTCVSMIVRAWSELGIPSNWTLSRRAHTARSSGFSMNFLISSVSRPLNGTMNCVSTALFFAHVCVVVKAFPFPNWKNISSLPKER